MFLYFTLQTAPNMEVLRKVGFYTVWVSALIMFYNDFRWLLYKIPILFKRVPTSPETTFSIALYEHNHQWFSSMYLISSVLCMTLEVAIGASETVLLPYYGPNELLLINVPFIFFVLSISVIALSSMRYEAMQGMCVTSFYPNPIILHPILFYNPPSTFYVILHPSLLFMYLFTNVYPIIARRFVRVDRNEKNLC